VPLAAKLLAELGGKLMLPVDHVVVSEIAAGAANQVVETIPRTRSPSISVPKPSNSFRA